MKGMRRSGSLFEFKTPNNLAVGSEPDSKSLTGTTLSTVFKDKDKDLGWRADFLEVATENPCVLLSVIASRDGQDKRAALRR